MAVFVCSGGAGRGCFLKTSSRYPKKLPKTETGMVRRTAIFAHSVGETPSGAPATFTRKEMIPTLMSDVVLETAKNLMYSGCAAPSDLNTSHLFQKNEWVTTIAKVMMEKNVTSIPCATPETKSRKLNIAKLKITFKTPTRPYRVNFQPTILRRSGGTG